MKNYLGIFLHFLQAWIFFLYPEHIIFIHTNDSHGYFYPRKEKEKMVYGPLALYAHLAAIRIEARQKNAYVVLTHGGDLNTGTPESDYVYARPDIELMNHLGYQVMVLGNHEFDISREQLRRQMEQSQFRWISANIYEDKPNEKSLLTAPVFILELGKIKIGFLGLTTQSTETIGNKQNMKGLVFSNPIAEAQKYATELAKKTNITVALTHLGFFPAEKEKKLAYEGDIALAQAVPQIDLILGGHSHTLVLGEVINGVPIYQAECYNRYAIRVDVEVNPGEKPKILSHQLISLSHFPESWEKIRQVEPYYTEYARAEELVKTALKATDAIFSKVIAESRQEFSHDRKILFKKSVPIGNLIADALRDYTQADLAIVNSGGIRAGLSKGPVSIRDILTILPFKNTVGVIELSGQELEELFQNLLSRESEGHFPQISGAEVHFNRDNQKVRIYLQKNGHFIPLNREKKYRIALNSYIAQGGNNYPEIVQRAYFLDTGKKDSEIFTEYLQKKKYIDLAHYQGKRIRFFRLKKL